VGLYVLTSTAAVSESSRQQFDNEQACALGKLRAERELLQQDAVPYTIIRPSLVVGPEDPHGHGWFYFQRLMDGGHLILTNGGVQSLSLSYSVDLAWGYLAVLNSERSLNQVYSLAQGENQRLVDWLRVAARLLDSKSQFVGISQKVMDVARFSYPEPKHMLAPSHIDISKAQAELGYETTPPEIWLAETVYWYRDAYAGPNSDGYDFRDAEVAFARRYQKAVKGLLSFG
jgi:nucleoside-diphosphate-sugar epimerase